MFKTINKNVSSEIVEKKSKFIANIFYVESVEEAEEKIKEIKKRFYDAKHNCFAFRIYAKEGVTERFSDDGEPSGTAGSPMLNLLSTQNLNNVVVIVTRYFGGILLGTGGLVRAYSGAAQKALEETEIIEKDLGLEVLIEINYSDLEKLKYYLKQNKIRIIDTKYQENIDVICEISSEKLETLQSLKNEVNFNIINIKLLRKKYIDI